MASDNRRAWNPLVAKLSQFAPLSDKDVGLLETLCVPEERFGAGANIVVEGESPRSAFVLTRGMACRYRLMPDGRRQILTILIPGDFFDLHGFLVETMDHSVATIGPTRIAAIGRAAVIDIVANHPRIGAALWWSAMQEQAMLRERIVALGRRSARGRMAYFLFEIVWRQRAIRHRQTFDERQGCLPAAESKRANDEKPRDQLKHRAFPIDQDAGSTRRRDHEGGVDEPASSKGDQQHRQQ